MPTTPLSYCAYAGGCSARVPGRFCPEHTQTNELRRPNLDLRRLYRTMRWRRLRAIVLQEEPVCPECAALFRIVPSTDVHHKQKATIDNFWTRSNLQALCGPHHSAHTARGE